MVASNAEEELLISFGADTVEGQTEVHCTRYPRIVDASK